MNYCYREDYPELYCDNCPYFQTENCPQYNNEDIDLLIDNHEKNGNPRKLKYSINDMINIYMGNSKVLE